MKPTGSGGLALVKKNRRLKKNKSFKGCVSCKEKNIKNNNTVRCVYCGYYFCRDHFTPLGLIKQMKNSKLIGYYSPFIGHLCREYDLGIVKIRHDEDRNVFTNERNWAAHRKNAEKFNRPRPIDDYSINPSATKLGDFKERDSDDRWEKSSDKKFSKPVKTKKKPFDTPTDFDPSTRKAVIPFEEFCIECNRGSWFRKPRKIDADFYCAYCKKPVCEKHHLSRKHHCSYLEKIRKE